MTLLDRTKSLAKRIDGDAALSLAAEASPSVAAYKQRARRVTLDGETRYIVEGDILLTPAELTAYGLLHEKNRLVELKESIVDAFAGLQNGLIGTTENGDPVQWPKGSTLRYCVERESFEDKAARYRAVVANVEQATRDWQSACGIRFFHESDGDAPGADRRTCLFRVRYAQCGGETLALAFFPNDPASKRILYVDPGYFGSHGYDPVGIFRHELGHVMGFRHEHIRSGAPAVCPDESTAGAFPFTDYDPRSVMHYYCGGVGTKEMKLSPDDMEAARRLYGPPQP